jgi:hypothetical protein
LAQKPTLKVIDVLAFLGYRCIGTWHISDKKKFVLPLADLKSTDRKSKNYQLLDDYSVWFVNNR